MLHKHLRILLLAALCCLFSLNVAMATNPSEYKDIPDEQKEQTAGVKQEDLLCQEDPNGCDQGAEPEVKEAEKMPETAPKQLETVESDCYWEYQEEKLGPFEGLADANYSK